jgi:hypothetical protein
MNPTLKIHCVECTIVVNAVRVHRLTGRRGDPVPLVASDSCKRELSIWIVNHHEDAIALRGIAGEDHLQIQESPELVKFVGLRRPVLLLPRQLGVVERKVVPLEVAGVVQDGVTCSMVATGGRASCSPVAGLRRWSSERELAVTSCK